jgi:hypothetical protein
MITALIFLLRLARAICGLYVIVLVFGLILFIAGAAVLPINLFLTSTIMVGLIGLFLSVFFGLRWLVNWLHKWKYGEAHPVLGIRRWAL